MFTTEEGKNAFIILRGLSDHMLKKKRAKEKLKYEEQFCGHDLALAKQEVKEFYRDEAWGDIPTIEEIASGNC